MSDPRRERTRPAELVGGSALLGAFAGGGVLLATRDWILAVVFFGVAFVVALVGIAMLLLVAGGGNDRSDDDDGGIPH